MTTEQVLAEAEMRGEPFAHPSDTPAVLAIYALYRTALNQRQACENIIGTLSEENRVLCEWNRRLAEENLALRGRG